jgi:hypothetical protein
MNLLKLSLLVFIFFLLIYGFAVLFQEKLALIKKYGTEKTNQDLINLANLGNKEIKKFHQKSKIYILLLCSSGGLLVVLHQLTKG